MRLARKNNQTHFLNIFLMLGVFTTCLLGVELFCYFYLKIPAHTPSVVYFDPLQRPPKRLKPNINEVAHGAYREFRYRITTDAYGFRKTYPFVNNERTYSFAILGDSQSFGVGINDEETFASLLAKNLNASVLNTACPGYNTIEEFLTYKNRVRQFKPRYVLLFFFAGNDPYENYKNRELYYGNSETQTLVQRPQNSSDSSWENLKNFLSKHSAIYNSLIKLRQIPQINQFLYHYKLVNPIPPSELAIFKKGDNSQALAHWQVTEKIITDLRDEVESNGSEFWIILIPDRYQIEEAHWQQWVSKYNLNAQDFDLMFPNRHLAEFSRKNGISFLDTTESLSKIQNQGKNVYWRIDAHLNALGHQVIADFVASRLSERQETMAEQNK